MEWEVDEGVEKDKYQVIVAFLQVQNFDGDDYIKWDAESSVDSGAHALTHFFVQRVVFGVYWKVLFG